MIKIHIWIMVAYYLCQQQPSDGVHGRIYVWKHHTCLRSSLGCSASSCTTSSVTSSTSSPVCTAARNMKVNETILYNRHCTHTPYTYIQIECASPTSCVHALQHMQSMYIWSDFELGMLYKYEKSQFFLCMKKTYNACICRIEKYFS